MTDPPAHTSPAHVTELGQVAQMAARGDPAEAVFTGVVDAASALLDGRPTALVRFEDDGTSVVLAARGNGTPVGARVPVDAGSLSHEVRRTGRPARIEDFTTLDPAGVRARWGVHRAAGVPVVVDGRPWGLLVAMSGEEPLPPDTEDRLGELTEIVAAAAAGVQAWDTLRDLAEEQAALRRVAELVARGVGQEDLFAAVAAEASALVHQDTVLVRADGPRTHTMVGVHSVHGSAARPGTRFDLPADDQGLLNEIMRTGRPARVDDYTSRQGRAYAHDLYGVRAAVGVPIVVDERIWGMLVAITTGGPMAPGVERRLAQFADLVAVAIAEAQARAGLRRLVDEQRALRTVAELVARDRPSEEVFAAVAAQASALLDGIAVTLGQFQGDEHLAIVATHRGPAPPPARVPVSPGTVTDRVKRHGVVVRVDDYGKEPNAELAATFGLVATVAAPIHVAGQVWGMLAATSSVGPLPAATEERLQPFTELVGAALANVQARAEVQALADGQAALRRVAELAVRQAPASEVFEAVAREASWLSGVDFTTVLRFEPDGSTEVVALSGAPGDLAVGMTAPGTGDGAVQRVWRTGRPARADDLHEMTGHWPRVAHEYGFHSSAAAPILVDGALWGALVVVARTHPLPAGIEAHLATFSELAGTTIGATEARRDLRTLADEQAALRRVAELVAHAAPLEEVFAAVATEASTLLGSVAAALSRYDDDDDSAVVVAAANSPAPVGLRVPAGDDVGHGQVLRTGRPARVDSFEGTSLAEVAARLGVTSAVTVPVVVEGRVWGTLSTSSGGAPPPPGTEERLAPFAELAGAAIANAENRAKLTASRARVVATADETRRRLQRDVHDGAQQRLVHTIVSLKLARESIAGGQEGSGLLEEALRHAQRASQDLRDVVRGILPAALTRRGLAAGLETLVDDVALPVRLRVAAPRLSPAVETTAYFLVAEALANVVKHADAHEARVDVVLEDGVLVVEVSDDGRGGADPSRGTGITGLLDRVEASDGTFTLTSRPGEGTLVRAELPVADADGTGRRVD